MKKKFLVIFFLNSTIRQIVEKTRKLEKNYLSEK